MVKMPMPVNAFPDIPALAFFHHKGIHLGQIGNGMLIAHPFCFAAEVISEYLFMYRFRTAGLFSIRFFQHWN